MVLIAAVTALYPSTARAVLDRRAWIFEQLGAPTTPTLALERRHRAMLGLANRGTDALTTLFAGTLDFSALELRVGGALFLFSGSGAGGAAVQAQFTPESQLLFVEAGRYAALGRGYFGRFAVALHQALPDTPRRWVAPSMELGILPTEKSPWTLHLKFNPFFPLHADAGAILLSLQSAYRFSPDPGAIELGGFLAWTYRLRESLPPPGIYEHMALSVGPMLSVGTGLGRLRLRLTWRLSIDKEALPVGSPVEVAYPTDITTAPDALLTWDIPL